MCAPVAHLSYSLKGYQIAPEIQGLPASGPCKRHSPEPEDGLSETELVVIAERGLEQV